MMRQRARERKQSREVRRARCEKSAEQKKRGDGVGQKRLGRKRIRTAADHEEQSGLKEEEEEEEIENVMY